MRCALIAWMLCGSIGAAAADEPARDDDRVRAVGVSGRYAHSADLDGGGLDGWWREPVAGELWAEATVGVLVGTVRGRTTATLANPVVALGGRMSARTTAGLALTLPAASTRGDAGLLAATLAADHAIDPSRFAPGASTIAAGFAQTRRGALGYLRAEVSLAWTFRPQAPSLPLIHADVSGAVAIARGLDLTAAFRSTGYLLTTAPGEDFVHVLALGVTVDAGATTTLLALEAPVDGAARSAGLLMATATIAVRP